MGVGGGGNPLHFAKYYKIILGPFTGTWNPQILESEYIVCRASDFPFHRKPKRNLGFETELPVSTYMYL